MEVSSRKRFSEPEARPSTSTVRSKQQGGARRRAEEEGQPAPPVTTTTTNRPPPPPSPTTQRAATYSGNSQSRVTVPSSLGSASLRLTDAEVDSVCDSRGNSAFSRTQSRENSSLIKKEKPGGVFAENRAEQQLESFPSGSVQNWQPVHEKGPFSQEEEREPESKNDGYSVETRNYFERHGVIFKPKNPFSHKVITVYAPPPKPAGQNRHGKSPPSKKISPSSKSTSCNSPACKSPVQHQVVYVDNFELANRTASQRAYIAVDHHNNPTASKPSFSLPGDSQQIVYLRLEPGCHRYTFPVENTSANTNSHPHTRSGNSSPRPLVPRPKSAKSIRTSVTAATAATATSSSAAATAATVAAATTTIGATTPVSSAKPSPALITNSTTSPLPPPPQQQQPPQTPSKMSGYPPGMEMYTSVSGTTLSRAQEKAELQQLNDRFAAYVHRVRVLAEKSNQLDSSQIIKSTQVMEVEIHNLKNMYEQELEKLRAELDACNHERTTHQVQVNKQLQYSSELQDRLNVETGKSAKLMEEVHDYQRRIGSLEGEVHDLRVAAQRPHHDLEQMQRKLDQLTRESEAWKHRYEHEEVARLEGENKIQQLMKKLEFNDKVNNERSTELHGRIESSAATVLSLESKIRELSRTDVSVAELLKQVREAAETELRKFQMESDETYNRNLTAMKAQLDNDAKAIERLETERTQLRGSVGEFQARIRSLEGQVANLEHQKLTLEDWVAVERNRAAESARSLERKLREVQDMLVVKMREVSTAREHSLPLKAEIEALKALLEDEEKRLRVPLGAVTSTTALADHTSLVPAYNITTTTTATAGAVPPTSAPPTANSKTFMLTQQAPPSSSATALAYNPPPPSGPIFSSSQPPLPMSFSPSPPVGFAPETRPYVPSPPLSLTYIPDQLQTPFGGGSCDCGGGGGMYPTGAQLEPVYGLHQYADENLDPQLYGYTGTAPLAKYSYETTPAVNRLAVEPSPPTTPRNTGNSGRAKSAPVQRQKDLNLIASDLGQGHDYFDQMFHDLQRDTLCNSRPKTSPQRNTGGGGGRPLSSLYHDYTVSTSSATGDLKIFEVHQEGKYVRLINDGVQEVEFGGFMLQQNVGGHPVAVFRFPPRTKFAPNSTITVYAGCTDHKLHNPPAEFVWKEQQKWGTGPECTTILCRPNGQAVAWTTAAHRFTRDAFNDGQSEADDGEMLKVDDMKADDDMNDDDSLTEINVNVNAPKPDPVYLRREKQQPPSLQPNKHPHGTTSASPVHPNSVQPRPYRYGNDNSTNNRQSRCQSTRPDPIAGQPYAGAAAQKMGSAPLRKYVSGVSTQQSSGIRTTGKSSGLIQGPPSPYHLPYQKEYPATRSHSSAGTMRSDGPVVRFTA